MQRSVGLDIVRSIAIVFVLLNHSIYILAPYIPEFISIYFFNYGQYGVQLFFILSGFLIGRIFIKEVLLKDSSIKPLIFQFWIRRWFRTVPNYYLFLLLYIIVSRTNLINYLPFQTASNFDEISNFEFSKYLFFLQNFAQTCPGFFGQSWSLTVEEWFYLLLPIPFFLLTQFNFKKSASGIAGVILTITIALVLWKVICFYLLDTFYDEKMVIFNLEKIMFGVLLAAIHNYFKENTSIKRKSSLVLGLTLWVIINIVTIKYILVLHPSRHAIILMDLLSSICFVMIVHYMNQFELKSRFFSKLFKIISLSSYSAYLSHFFILVFFVDNIYLQFLPKGLIGSAISFILFFVTTILVSYQIYKWFELPVMRLREHKLFKSN